MPARSTQLPRRIAPLCMVRTRAAEVSQVGRNAQGVTLMRVADDEKLMAIESLDVIEDDADPEAELEFAE